MTTLYSCIGADLIQKWMFGRTVSFDLADLYASEAAVSTPPFAAAVIS